MIKHTLRVGVGLLVLVLMLAHATGWWRLASIEALDRSLYDIALRITMPGTIDPRIAIVDIDEKSLSEIGRWPWRRDRMATLVNRLFETYQIRQLGFDIVMAEADESSGLKTLDALATGEFAGDARYQESLEKLRPSLDYDGLFAASLRNRPVILGYYLSNAGISTGALPAPAIPAPLLDGHEGAITRWRNHGGNLPALQKAALDAGHFNPIIDPDGSVRRVPLIVEHGGAYYEAFSLAMLRAYFNNARIEPVLSGAPGAADSVMEGLQLVDERGVLRTVALDDNAAAWIPYRGPERSFAYVSAADVLAGRLPADALRGKIIIIGTTAPGLRDLRTTPVGEVYPGMEVHANLISGVLDARVKQRPGYVVAIEALMLLLIGLAMIFLFRWTAPGLVSIKTVLLTAAVIGATLLAFEQAHLILPLGATLVLMTVLFIWNMSFGYFVEARAKLQITQRFGQYVPPELVQKMIADPSRYSMDSRRADLTVLFSDVRGFTEISEGLEPEALAAVMNEYLGAMTAVIRRHGGTLDKYIGDAIVAFWGAPVDDVEHARHAVLAALDMQTALVELNRHFATKGWPKFQIGIGLNSGSMTVGDMGSNVRLAYTVMGDAVNLGARLEAKTKDYGVGIMVGEATHAVAKGIVFRELDRVQVKGKEQAVRVYEAIGREEDVTPAASAELSQWTAALAHYLKQEWDQAGALLSVLQAAHPQSRLYPLYAERITAFRAAPPGPDWIGVTRFVTK